MRLRIVIVVLVVAGAALLAGCGSSKKSTTASTSAPSNQATSASTGTAPKSYGNCGHGAGTACESPASAHITVTPDKGLASGQTVTVKVTGFLPNSAVGVSQCVAVVTSDNYCDTNTDNTFHTDASGAYTGTIVLTNPIKTTQNGTVTCNSTGNCSIGASNFAAPDALPSANEDVGFGS
jgi:uncharacterized protein YceK